MLAVSKKGKKATFQNGPTVWECLAGLLPTRFEAVKKTLQITANDAFLVGHRIIE